MQGSFGDYSAEPGQSGIRNSMGSQPLIYCNNVDGTTNGIYFTGAAYGTDLSGNNIRHHKWGLHLDNSAIIEQQYFKGNLWYNAPVAGGIGAWYENVINATLYPFRYDPNNGWLRQSRNHRRGHQLLGFQLFPGQNALCDVNGQHSYCDQFENGLCEGCTTELDQRIAADELENDPYTEETKWMLQGELYEKLEEHPDLLLADQEMADFHADMQGTAVEEFKPVSDAYEAIFALDATIADDLAQDRSQLEDLLGQLAVATAQLGDETLTEAQLQDLRITISGLQADVADLSTQGEQTLASVTGSRMTAADDARLANASVGATDAIEVNEQTVNEIYLNTLAKDVNEFTPAEVGALYAIADQCPMVGGNAVYRARSLYSLIDDEQVFDDPALCLPYGIIVRSVVQDMPSGVQVLPNPAADEAMLLYRLEEDSEARLVLYDAVGKQVQRHELSADMQRYYFSTVDLTAGPYHFVVLSGQSLLGEGKLVIVR